MNNEVSFIALSQEKYDSLENKDIGTFYRTESNVYLGETLLASNIATSDTLGIVKPDNTGIGIDGEGQLHVLWNDIPAPALRSIKSLNVTMDESTDDTPKMSIQFTNTSDLIVNDKPLVSYASTSLLQNKVHMPANATDGTTVKTFGKEDAGAECTYEAEIMPEDYGQSHFYKTFSFSDDADPIVTEGVGQEVNIPIPATIPEISVNSEELTYNAVDQSPFSNYSLNQLDASGTLFATDAGNYQCIFTPKDGYTWKDGSAIAKEYSWSIAKAQSEIKIDETEVTLDPTSLTKELSFEYIGENNDIYIVNSNENVVTVQVVDNKIILTSLGQSGNATIQLKSAETTNYLPGECTISVSCKFKMADYTWKEIKDIFNSGKGQQMFKLGDTKLAYFNDADQIQGAYPLTMELYDWHDMNSGDGIKALFISKECIPDKNYSIVPSENNGYFGPISKVGSLSTVGLGIGYPPEGGVTTPDEDILLYAAKMQILVQNDELQGGATKVNISIPRITHFEGKDSSALIKHEYGKTDPVPYILLDKPSRYHEMYYDIGVKVNYVDVDGQIKSYDMLRTDEEANQNYYSCQLRSAVAISF